MHFQRHMPEFILCLESFVYIWSNKVRVSFVTLVGLFIRFLNPKQFVRFTKSKTWLLDDFNRSVLKFPITYIYFLLTVNLWRVCIMLSGRHSSCHYGGVYRQHQQWHFFVEANFKTKGFTTIKRFRQVMNVLSVYCVFNTIAHSTCFCCWVTVEKSVSMHLMIR